MSNNDVYKSGELQGTAAGPEEQPDPIEMDLCQKLTDSLSVSSLTHSLTPIPSLTDRTISISRNTNSLTRNDEYNTEDMNANVKLTNWTTRSFCTSTEDMISSGIFDSDIEASGNETVESLPRESISTNEESAYEWQDISTSDLWDEDDVTLVPRYRKPRDTVESSSEDEIRKPRKFRPINERCSERSEDSYPHSSNRTYSNLDDFRNSSTPISDVEELDSERSESTAYSISKVTTWTLSDLDDSPGATCSSGSSDISVSDNIFDAPPEEFVDKIEHNMIATRYGLPYDFVKCNCHAEAQLLRNREPGIKLCKSGSCHKFEEKFGELDGRSIRLWHTIKRLNGFKKACRIYNSFMNKPDPAKKTEFRKADYKLKVNYPYYWVHLSEKYKTELTDEEEATENDCKEEVIESCRRVLTEQNFFSQHYQVTMRDFGENVKFSVDYRHLHKDFKVAATFLMKEYPSLFEHLMVKYGFEAFAEKRITIDENRWRFIHYANKSEAHLREFDRIYYKESLEKIKKGNQL